MGAVFISSLACGRLVHPSTAHPRGSKIASSNGLAGTDIDLRFYKAWSTLCIILFSRGEIGLDEIMALVEARKRKRAPHGRWVGSEKG